MYHCHIQFYLTGCPRGTCETIQKLPPLKGFTHSFSESGTPEPALAARADVVLAGLSGPEPVAALRRLAAGMREDAQLILLADRERAGLLTDCLPRACDLWLTPMPEWELRFRFQRWQQACKQGKDLWQSEQFLDSSINGTPQMVWYKTREGIYERVNDNFCRVAGKSRAEIEGHTYVYTWDVERNNPESLASEQEAMRLGKTCVSDGIIPKDGGDIILKTYKSPLYDLDGSVMGIVGIAVNVTQEQVYEKELLEKKQLLEMLFSSMDCGVICHSVDGHELISINQAALRLLGYTSKEEMIEDGFDLVAQTVLEEDKVLLRKRINSLQKVGESLSGEYRARHKDGSLWYILGNVKLIEENGRRFYQRFLVDITAQKLEEAEKWARKDQEFQYQERMFDLFSTFLSDNIDDVYMVLDEDGKKVEFVSTNIERVLGVSRDEIMESMRSLGLPKYTAGDAVGWDTLTVLEPGMALGPMETERVHRKTGERKWFLESVYCVSIQGKKKIVAYISDRTRERVSQNALSEALETAKVASQAKSSFLSSVSHDIRTPMNAIMGFVTLLQEEANHPELVLEYTQKISAASQHLLGLINDVLDMNKIESGSTVLNISEFSMAEVIDELNAIIRPQTRAKNQTFEIHATSLTSEHLLGDRMRISQIMINILSNAVKYTQDGGRIELDISELPHGDSNYCRIRFVIRDNGQGMSEAYQKVIFEPFTREQSIIWNQIQGSGLGMAITKNLVELMGGTIRVDSRLGEGSAFTVELDLRIQEKEDDPRFWERHGILRVFVADDDENICRDIVKKMAGTGVEIRYATSGTRAVEMIRAARKAGEPYDLILLDWQMPDLNGLEVAQLIRRKYLEKVPILLFTSYDWDDIRDEAVGLGIDHFLPKPFFMSSFKDTVRRMNAKRSSSPLNDGESAVAGRHVLVVDDIEVNRIILTKIMTVLGATCDIAVDGQEAVDKFLASQPGAYDMIFMDIQMPRLNGYEATRAIRASSHPAAKEIAIVAMTANAFLDDIQSALDSGMDAHVSKPIVLEQLKSTIKDVLERKKK